MPRLPINNNNTVIYKLCCLDPDVKEIYIGHSTEFTVRKGSHKSHCNNEKDKLHNLKVYQYIRANGGWNNWDMVLVEKYPCNDVLEAKQREQFHISDLHSTLNSFNSIKSETYHQEYRDNHKDETKLYSKEYYAQNIESIKEYKKVYTENNAQQIQNYRDSHKQQQKEYRDTHKERAKELDRIRRVKVKALKILQKNAEIIS